MTHLLLFIKHLPWLIQQVCIEALNQDAIRPQVIFDLLITNHADAVVEVVEEHCLCASLHDEILESLC